MRKRPLGCLERGDRFAMSSKVSVKKNKINVLIQEALVVYSYYREPVMAGAGGGRTGDKECSFHKRL